MKKRILLFLIVLNSALIECYAQDKIGDIFWQEGIKYSVTSIAVGNKTVKVISKGFVKYRGDIVIPKNAINTKYNIEYKVSEINKGTFFKSKITSITIPKTITKIGLKAFKGSANLTQITSFVSNPSELDMGTEVFDDNITANCKLLVPEGTKSLYKNADQWQDFATIEEMEHIGVINVKLNKNELTLHTGMSDTLVAMVSPTNATNADVTWTSDNEEFAKVDGKGVVTALKVGTANITVTTEDGYKTDVCAVTVIEIIDVVSVSLNKPELTLKTGMSDTLVAMVSPTNATNKNVTWTIDNEEFAKVDDKGVVTALKVGEANITVTTEDGNFTATCKVIVEQNEKIMLGEKFKQDSIQYEVTQIENGYTIKVIPTENDSYSGSINIPSKVTYKGKELMVNEIEDKAFLKCANLINVTIPSSINKIGKYVFVSCANLTSIKVSMGNPNYSSVDGVFFNKDITTLLAYPIGKENASYEIPNTVDTISAYSFYKSKKIKTIKIPNSVILIGDKAFDYCDNLSDVKIGNSVKRIGSFAFAQCHKLKEIIIPNSVTILSKGSFNTCKQLQYVKMSDSLEHIGNRAFANCFLLQTITIPSTVSSISVWAFYKCSSLDTIKSFVLEPDSVKLGSQVFAGVNPNKCILQIPANTLKLYQKAEQWKEFKNIQEITTGIVINEEISQIKIYPTIVNHGFTIESENKLQELTIYSLSGRQVHQSKILDHKQFVDISGLQSGVYIVKVNNKTIKIVKQ